MSCYLPTYWVHNDDGTCEQRGGAPGTYHGTVSAPGGHPVRRPDVGPQRKPVHSALFKHVLEHGEYLANANIRNGRRVITTCDGCSRRPVNRCLNIGNTDLCMDCVNYLQKPEENKFQQVLQHGTHKTNVFGNCDRCSKDHGNSCLSYNQIDLCYKCVAEIQ